MAYYVDAFGKVRNSAMQTQKTIDANKTAMQSMGKQVSAPLQQLATPAPGLTSAQKADRSYLDDARLGKNLPGFTSSGSLGAGNTLYRTPGQGDSPWLSMMKQSQEAEMARSRDSLGRQLGSERQSAWDRMAASGGLSSGARERAAADSQMMGFEGNQLLGQENRKTLADLNVADQDFNEQNRRTDVQNRLGMGERRTAFDQNMWKTRGQIASSNSMADLMAKYGV